ncbi:dihydropteroate synthase [Geminocystis sp. NIES-3709]|uniref:dihydropteroate synthase n=1 Tax=Geminocystis sp. NIES-3709 TaxID=1617448 RepID=UPI0005FC53CE|nr:dihydropteroate synthase [Geminocystis sp. NIES-3709]BAQ63645.1 dihydropteroate synthase [Geminocystis sp. NIES-3709]
MSDSLIIRNHRFIWGSRTYLMGILNVTPDSFSDGGQFNHLETALKQAQMMIDRGVDIIDIGGQSTRPGAKQITLEEELERVIPIIKAIREVSDIPISIDTTRAIVAQTSIEKGADIVNDISGGTFDRAGAFHDRTMLSTVAKLQVPIILMHIKGTPKTMQTLTDYQDLIGEIKQFLQERIEEAITLGIKKEHIILDPGIGFAKNYEQNLEILRNITEIKTLGFPVLIGTSRKSFIGKILNRENPQERIWGTAATCSYAITQGADILRVHDVSEMYDVIRVTDALTKNSY